MAYTVEKLERIIALGDEAIDNFERNLTQEDKEELVALYKQEGIYYYTQVAPSTMDKDICNESVERINNLTTRDSFRYDSLAYEICMFNIRNSRFIDNRLIQA